MIAPSLTIKSAFSQSLPVLMGYSTMGAAFGILLSQAGFSIVWALLMSVTILSGSLQFAAVGMLQAGLSLPETAFLSLVINIRYAMYGLSLIVPYQAAGLRRFYMMFALTDETYALQVLDERPEQVDRSDFMFLIAFFNHCYWILGSMVGALAGKMLTFNSRGIDFAMTALFLVILTEQLLARENRLPALIGSAATLAALLLCGTAQMLPAAMVLMIVCFLVGRKQLDRLCAPRNPAVKKAEPQGAKAQ